MLNESHAYQKQPLHLKNSIPYEHYVSTLHTMEFVKEKYMCIAQHSAVQSTGVAHSNY